MHYRADIDGLRAIAVLGVVLFHFGVGSLPGGFVGVDIFFVISGYLITKLIVDDVERGQFSFRRFYVRRIRRLFPALIFTVTCSLLAAFFLFSPEQMTRLGTSIAAAVFSVSNVLFWSESGYFDASSHVKPLLHTWSLSVEEQFYFIWPFALVWLMRFGRKAVIAALFVIFAVSLGGNVAAEEYRSALFYLSPFRFFEFALGAMLVFIPPARSNALMEFSLALGLALICFAYRYFTEATLFPSYPALVPVFGACLAIYGGRALWTGYLLRNGVAAGIGLISYSLYLAHWPLLVFWQYVRIDQIGRNERVALLALTFAVALFMYRFIERPFRMRNGSGFSLLPKSFMTGAIVCAILISAGGIHASATHGWLWRLGAKDQLLREFVAGDRIVDAAYGGDGCAAPCSTSDDDRAPDIIVIGDSHSRQYYLGAKVSLPDLKIDFYEYSSCQFYSVEYTRDFTGYADPISYDRGCRAARKKAFDAIRRAPGALVIVGEYWDPVPMLSERDGVMLPVSTPDAYYRFVGEEIDRLKSDLGIRSMVVLGSVPTASGVGSPMDCFGRPFLAEPSCMSHPRTNPVVTQREKTNELLREHLSQSVTFVDPFGALCGPTDCLIISDGPLYSDSTHLSGLGSKTVMASIASTIRNQLSHYHAEKASK